MKNIIGFLLVLLVSNSSFSLETKSIRKDHVSVSIVSEYDELSADIKDFTIAVKFQVDPNWHIYWRNPGDSGTAPKALWSSNQSLNFSDFYWPLPSAIPVSPLLNYGYENIVYLPVKVNVTSTLSGSVEIKSQLEWLVCKVECIPGKAEINFKIPVNNRKISFISNEIYRTLSHVPLVKHDIESAVLHEKDFIILKFKSKNIIFNSYQNFYFFPYDGVLLDHAALQEARIDKNKNLILKIRKNESFHTMPDRVVGALALERKGEPKISFETISEVSGRTSLSYFLILVFAFIGGAILNLMPCVFPVISIKILSFIEASKKTKTKISTHGWAYTLGILCSFFILSAVLLILRSLGENLGWGFQLQSPLFVTAMVVLFYLMGLNLLGLFEIGERLSFIGGPLQKGDDLRASFFTGVLATIVATPCTAPFMGTALGVAITLPSFAAMLVFLMIGVGLAFPYLLLTYMPKLLKFLPKPGPWMKKFKNFLSIPMFLTVVWLLWVLSFQIHFNLLIFVCTYLVVISLAIWLLKLVGKKSQWILYAVLAIGTVILGQQIYFRTESNVQSESADKNWNKYSKFELESLQKNSQSYFIDFTAAWCLTCQVNKRLVLNTVPIQQAFLDKNVKLFKADWTNQDPVITKALEKFNRNSVPLYVLYNPKTKKEIILPEILTDQIIMNALEQL